MNEVTMLELRQDAESVIERVQHGEELTLTYRGKAVLKLQPLQSAEASPIEDDPLLQLAGAAKSAKPLSNDEMDSLVYGL